MQPATHREARKLDTGTDEMLIAILCGSKNFQTEKPFTTENLTSRFKNSITGAGFADQSDLIDFLKSCVP